MKEGIQGANTSQEKGTTEKRRQQTRESTYNQRSKGRNRCGKKSL